MLPVSFSGPFYRFSKPTPPQPVSPHFMKSVSNLSKPPFVLIVFFVVVLLNVSEKSVLLIDTSVFFLSFTSKLSNGAFVLVDRFVFSLLLLSIMSNLFNVLFISFDNINTSDTKSVNCFHAGDSPYRLYIKRAA